MTKSSVAAAISAFILSSLLITGLILDSSNATVTDDSSRQSEGGR